MKSIYHLIIILLSLFFSVCETTKAQAPEWVWAKAIGGLNEEHGMSIAADASGNVYTTGYFEGTVDFDPGAGTTELTATGTSDIFISKLDASGNFLWAKRMGGASLTESYSITLDATGNIYTTGRYIGTVDFDPGADTFNLTSVNGGYYDIFISKLNSSGDFIWAKTMGGLGSILGYSIAVDASGNVYTTGVFLGTVDFDPGTGTVNLTAISYDMFISKLDGSGNFIWAKRIGGDNYDYAYSVAIDNAANGEVYLTGAFEGTVDFDPGTDTFNIVGSSGSADIFICKLDSGSNFIWAKAIIGIAGDAGTAIATDNSGSGNVYVTGTFQLTVDFDPNAGVFNLISAGVADIFILKLDNAGNLVWAKGMGGPGFDYGYSIALDPAGSGIYTTGQFEETADFDPDAGTFNLISNGYSDIFISKLDNAGNFVWAKAAGGTVDDHSLSIALDAFDNAHVTGNFISPSISFDSNTITNADASGSGSDIFIAKLDHVTGIESVHDNSSISVYPNPAADYFTITLGDNNKIAEAIIIDITGKIIYKTTAVGMRTIEADAKDFAPGVYSVRVQGGDFVETKKLIVAK